MELTDLLITHFRLDDKQKAGFLRLGVKTIRDLLYYFPSRYGDISDIKLIRDVAIGETVTLYGKITKLSTRKSFTTRRPMGEAILDDGSGLMPIVWFNQAYMAKMVHEGQSVKLTGKVTERKGGGSYLANPELEKEKAMPIDVHDTLFKKEDGEHPDIFAYPVYPETRGITSRFIFHAIQKIFKSGILEKLQDYLPETLLKKYSLPSLKSALIYIHTPHDKDHAEAARKRFAFEEVFFIQIKRHQDKLAFAKQHAYQISVDKNDIADFMGRFPFTATDAQQNAIDTILENIARPSPMARLLEGDVGSGKTAVAATAAYSIIKNRPFNQATQKMQTFGSLQVAYMAPTEILATQLFENFITYFRHTGINIGLITGSGCRKFPSKVASAKDNWTAISRTQLLKWVAAGEIPILIGTHALIQKSVKFKHLALVIIDEQHRFGTNQRAKLARKEGFAPHLLSMTATPIPRTLALTVYGDLDLTLLDQMPHGRKPVITEIIAPDKRKNAYEEIKKELANGRQLYVICPRINEPDPDQELALNVKSVTAEAERLHKEVFPDKAIDMLHSKMTKEKKEEVMMEFARGDVDILVATSVVEVGVNVPNATLIIIEGAERFGLAQLHQLRGRVIRSNHQAYCYLFADAKSQKTVDRLKALKTAKNGFELAELDLALRGAGELGGAKQWGITDLGMEAIKNLKMVEAARTEAQKIIAEDPSLSKFPLLEKTILARHFELHFE